MGSTSNARIRTLATLAFSLLAFSFVSFSVFSVLAAAQDVAIPTLTPYVTDLAGVIEPQYTDAINAYASQLEAATTDEIAVLTVRSTQPMSIDEYAVRVFEKNGIGQKGKDNGVLLVVATEDRQWRIEVGYGLEGQLNDAKAGRIGRTYMVPYFQKDSYGEGMYLAVRAVGDVIAGNQTSSFDPGQSYEAVDAYWIVLAFAGLLLVIGLAVAFALRCPKCGSWRMRTETKGDKVCRVCKKCGYKKCRKRNRAMPFFFFFSSGGGHGSSFGGGGGGFGGGGSGGGGAGGGY